MDTILKLKDSKSLWKKILYYVAFPIVLILLGIKLIQAFRDGKVEELMDNAKKTDAILKQKAKEANDAAEKAKAKADAAQEEIDNIPEDEDWHRK